MKDIELNKITGGQTINGTILNALSRFINTIFELGRAVGSSIRRVKKHVLSSQSINNLV